VILWKSLAAGADEGIVALVSWKETSQLKTQADTQSSVCWVQQASKDTV